MVRIASRETLGRGKAEKCPTGGRHDLPLAIDARYRFGCVNLAVAVR